MFCDLVGSTALSARLDPEDMREIIGAYHRCCAEQITKAGGFVAKYMGDGVLAYFGYPQAHEDDAERAVRSALALIDAIQKLRAGHDTTLQVRIGIATGLAVVGDLIGEGDAQERGVVGETPNLAARLQALAEPGQVVISPSTRRLTGGLFRYRDMGLKALKGLAEPVQAWQVLGFSAVEGRFEAQHETSLTPLVGREEEIELLLRRWKQAKTGEGRVVLLTGEPGIGKSRLTVAIEDAIRGEEHLRLHYFCSPHHQGSAFHPITAQLERTAGFERKDSPEAKLDKLGALLVPESLSEGDLPLLAELLSLPTASRFPPSDVGPQRKKERTLTALLRQLEGLTQRQPVLTVYEDVQWIDPSSRELLEMVVERAAHLPILLIITFRPEFQPPWTGQAHVTMLALNRLGRREGMALIERVAGKEPLPPDIIAEIAERTDGIPLFVEELTKAVLEAASGQEGMQRTLSTTPTASFAVPATLHASLMARLDRLGAPAKEIAQIGAAIGREFAYELLLSVAQRSVAELQAGLDRLADAGLVFCRGSPPHATFLFKHALIRDAAYSSLLRSQRQQLHARIATIIEQSFSDLIESEPELLAQHCTEAGTVEKAITYWEKAGLRAAAHSANQEAVAHLQKGLELLETLPTRADDIDQELRLLLALGPALMNTRSSAAPEIGRAYARARELAQKVGRSAELFPTVWGSWLFAYIAADLSTATRLVEELFGLARDQHDPALMLQAHHAAWPTLMSLGTLEKARQHIGDGLALYQRDAHSKHAHLYGGHDPAVCGFAIGAMIAAALGYLDQALWQLDQGRALAESLGHLPTLSQSLGFAAELHYVRREPRAVEDVVASVLPILSEHGSAVGIANATMLRGWALIAQGEVRQGSVHLREGLNAWRATGSMYLVPYRLARAADAYRIVGNTEEGLCLVAEALKAMERFEDRWFEADLHRLQGELLLLGGVDPDEAEICLKRALAAARLQGAHLLELRAATSIARVWHSRNSRSQARDLLAPIYGWFTEGFDTPDLKEAKVLLDELT
jgi:class 3 adenylate cyclase/predicted ATPase